MHGETLADGSIAVVTGGQQWIADYLVSSGQKSSLLGIAVRGLDVRLIHQMAGFVPSDEITVMADNFGLVPSENVNVILYTSPSVEEEIYSGVILEWTGHSWRIYGYDNSYPAFTVIPPDPNSARGVISIATTPEPTILPWHPSTYYVVGVFVVYQNSVYKCASTHMSGSTFENNYWTPQPDMTANPARAPRVYTYARNLNKTQRVAYGTEFTTYQQVANFLLGYQSWLVSRGWIFDDTDASGNILDWSLAVKEFLTWSQIQWQPGNFIALSPSQLFLKFVTPNGGTILNVENNNTGFFGLTDRSGNPIRQRDANINRLDGQITLSANNADIFCARLELVNIEHALVFSNVTIFDDDIYLPLFNMRQIRLKLICNRSTNWAGRLDAPGFVIIGNQLEPNFEKLPNDVRLMFDIELADNATLREYARHVIGFQERSYLNNLLLSDVEQFEFYQGMIQQKGAPGVFEKLMRSQIASSSSNLEFLEEWAFRVGVFGAPVDPFITFLLTQTATRANPQMIRFVSMSNAPVDWIIQPLSSSNWYDKPESVNFYVTQATYEGTAYPTAGPVD